ncbi:MAG: hypothetical protein MI754_15595, partial [Chromatiales bacterium]|nr:hypothetical protein [Chromatiales bacterium]
MSTAYIKSRNKQLIATILSLSIAQVAVSAPSIVTLTQTTINVTDAQSDTYTTISAGAVFTDADGSVPAGSQLIVAADGSTGGSGGHSLDHLKIDTDGTGFSIGLNASMENTLLLNGSYLATLAAGSGLAPLYVKFTNGATVAEVQQVLENIQWRNIAPVPGSTRDFEFILRDGMTEYSDTLTINISDTNEAPRNRTDTVMTELNLTEVHEEYTSLDGWHYHRGPSEIFTNEVFDGDTRIKVMTGDDDAYTVPTSHLGYIYGIGDATQASVDLYVPDDWGTKASPTFWVHGYTDAGVLYNFPIIWVNQADSTSLPETVSYWNGTPGTDNLPTDIKLNSWVNLAISLDDAADTLTFTVTGQRTDDSIFTLTSVQTGVTSTTLQELSLHPRSANSGETYTAYYDNITWNTGDASTNSIWKSVSVDAGSSIPISGLEVADVDRADILTTELTTTLGTLNTSTGGGSGTTISGAGTGRLTLSGTQTQINAALAGLNFSAFTHPLGNPSISITTTDAGGLSDTDTIALAIAGDL